MAKYETEIDPNDENQSQAVILNLVGRDKHVLDMGCSTGYLARGLSERGNRVTGLELQEEWAERARPYLDELVVGDLDTMDLVERFGEARFDVVVYGDVLEHLKDPAAVLVQTRRILKEDGVVVVSMPNVAHGDLRLSLFAGYWDYRPTGLLDDTHLRFFTLRSIERLMSQAGLTIGDLRRVRVPLFGTELAMTPSHFSPDVVEMLRRDPDIDVYQYVYKAHKNDRDGTIGRLHRTTRDQQDQLTALGLELDAARERLSRLAAELADAHDEHLRTVRDAELARRAHGDARAELDRVYATRVFRWSALPRRLWGRARQAR